MQITQLENSQLIIEKPEYAHKAKTSKNSDTAFIAVSKTPAGKLSKRLFWYRLNGEVVHSEAVIAQALSHWLNGLRHVIPKGYSILEVVVYSKSENHSLPNTINL